LCLRHSEFSSQRPQKKIKSKFNRKFVRVSKDTRYNTKYLTVTKKQILSMEKSSSSEAVGSSVKSNSEHYMELQIYYHIYKSQMN
jgi:hypothetical protein